MNKKDMEFTIDIVSGEDSFHSDAICFTYNGEIVTRLYVEYNPETKSLTVIHKPNTKIVEVSN